MGNEVVINAGRRKKEGFVEARLVTTSNKIGCPLFMEGQVSKIKCQRQRNYQ
jgi:hypothetical protein